MNIFDFIFSVGLSGGGDGDGDAGGSGGQSGGGQNLPVMPEWAANFPGELIGDEASRNFLGRFKGEGVKVEVPVEMVKSAIESHRAIGGMVTIPGENATLEQKTEFNKKLGVPDKPDDYSLKAPDGAPEGLFKDDQIKAFRNDAHELGVPKAKAEELFNRFAGRQVETYNGMMTNNKQGEQQRIDALKTDLGTEYDATVAVADKAASFASPAMFDKIQKAGLSADPDIIKGFAKIGKALGEGMLKGHGPGVSTEKLTKAQLETMMADPKYQLPENDATGKAWRAKVEAGFETLYGTGTAGADIGPSSGRSMHGE